MAEAHLLQARPRRWLHSTARVARAAPAVVAVLLAGCGEAGSDVTGSTSTTSSSTATPTTTTTTSIFPLFTCDSTGSFQGKVANAAGKGIAIDDITLSQCPDKLLGMWPHTQERVTSLRLFAAWKPEWDESMRKTAWAKLKEFVEANDAKVLMGAEMSCDKAKDDKMWQWDLELMELLGKDRIMGVAIGNEMDNFPGCLFRWFWWSEYWKTFQKRIADIDSKGFHDVKVTVVWSMGALAGSPFIGKVNTFVQQAYKKYAGRWVWTFNPYAIWDKSQMPRSRNDCQAVSENVVKMDYTKNLMKNIRSRVRTVTGNDDYTLWIGETGWSAPAPAFLSPVAKICPNLYTPTVLRNFYRSFLSWDLALTDSKPADHVFYFTVHDSPNHGSGESFGLVGQCNAVMCKTASNETLAPQYASEVVI